MTALPSAILQSCAVGLFAAAVVSQSPLAAVADEAAKTVVRSQTFDHDPLWEGRNNRIVPPQYPTIVQDFGYSRTHHAGRSPGEMGGKVTRASEPAFYAARIGLKTLDQRLSASGTLALTKSTPGGGVFFGFFRAEQPGGGGRPTGSLGLNLDTEHSGGRLAVRLITAANQSCGTFITPFLPGKFRPTPLRNDGTRYTWKLDYDPAGAGGRGQFTFAFHGDAPKPGELETPGMPESHRQEARARFPSTTSFTVDLPDGYRQQGTVFDHFGLMNMMKAGGQLEVYFDDLVYDGESQDFAEDPHWDASGNRAVYQATDVAGAHHFGFSKTSHAGGQPGEIGGTFWRTEKDWGYYADKVGPLSLAQRLEARGKVSLFVGAPDADMCFGFFRTDGGDVPPNRSGDFLGIKVGGPTRVGHYFLPAFVTADGQEGRAEQGPVLKPGATYEWSLVYDPDANGGNGALTATLGDETVTHNLKPGQKAKARGARFDRFGLFSVYPGGQLVKLYLDDLEYTAASP